MGPPKSTGSPLVPSPQSRTRDPADHAGPSHPPELWRVPTRSLATHLSPSLSRSSSTATSTPTVAEVDPCKPPSSGSRRTWPSSSPTTPTPERMAPAWRPPTPDNSRALATRPSPPTQWTPSCPPSRLAQSPLLSKLTSPSSSTTLVESSTLLPAEPTLTTVSSSSATEPTTVLATTWLRTPGAAPGARMATSSSPETEMETEPAAAKWPQSTQPSELVFE